AGGLRIDADGGVGDRAARVDLGDDTGGAVGRRGPARRIGYAFFHRVGDAIDGCLRDRGLDPARLGQGDHRVASSRDVVVAARRAGRGRRRGRAHDFVRRARNVATTA